MLTMERETEKKPRELTPDEQTAELQKRQDLMQKAIDSLILGGAL